MFDDQFLKPFVICREVQGRCRLILFSLKEKFDLRITLSLFNDTLVYKMDFNMTSNSIDKK